MIEYISGQVVSKSPSTAVIETNGVGYLLHISLHTYESLSGKGTARLLAHLAIREDAHTLYGFYGEAERSMFRSLISVSGIGPTSAMAALSTYKPQELQQAITMGDVDMLKRIKGIGPKSAQRIIVDLRDKVQAGESIFEIFNESGNTIRSEALKALRNLGFDPRKAQKVVDDILDKGDESIKIEDLIKQSLKSL
jgi:Holliday junction DNA helicase RuvA